MSLVSAMAERNVFEALRAELASRRLGYRASFWLIVAITVAARQGLHMPLVFGMLIGLAMRRRQPALGGFGCRRGADGGFPGTIHSLRPLALELGDRPRLRRQHRPAPCDERLNVQPAPATLRP